MRFLPKKIQLGLVKRKAPGTLLVRYFVQFAELSAKLKRPLEYDITFGDKAANLARSLQPFFLPGCIIFRIGRTITFETFCVTFTSCRSVDVSRGCTSDVKSAGARKQKGAYCRGKHVGKGECDATPSRRCTRMCRPEPS